MAVNTSGALRDRIRINQLYGLVKANSTYDEVLAIIKGKVEGGYSHPVHWWEDVYIKGKTNNISAGSGETMFGEDRAAGNTESTESGRKFWALVDTWSGLGKYAALNRKHVARNWPGVSKYYKNNKLADIFVLGNTIQAGSFKYRAHGQTPSDPALKEKMLQLARDHVKLRYDDTLNSYIKTKRLREIIESDGRLIYYWIRLRYNGPAFAQKAGIAMETFFQTNPNCTAEELVEHGLEWKWKYADGLGKSGGVDSKYIIKLDTLKAAEFFGWPKASGVPTTAYFGGIKDGQAPPPPAVSGASVASSTGSGGNGQTTDPLAQNKKYGDTEDSTPKQPTGPITQIKRLFKPTIRPVDIDLDVEAESLQNKRIIAATLGYTPVIFYNGVDIKATDISSFSLYHDGMLPKIDCVIQDTYGIFKKTGMPGDDTKISLFMSSKSRILASVRLDFKVLEFKEISPGKYKISAIIDIPRIYLKKYSSFSDKTSLEALQELAKDLGLGFCTNITGTNDKQNWINTSNSQRHFISDIVEHSYVSDTSFQICYIDYYYNLCFVDISREYDRDVSEDVGVTCVGFDTVTGTDKKNDDKIEPLVLTNNMAQSSGYISKYKVTNNSTTLSLKNAYRTDVKYLDIQKKEILYFTVEAQTGDPSKTQVLKATSGDEQFYKENTKSSYGGKLDANEDGSGNLHANSVYTIVNNRRNLRDFAKVSSLMYLPNCNLNLYPYRKVKVVIINPKQTPDEDLISTRLTGDWLISSIEFTLNQGKFMQVLNCLKRELSLTKAEQDANPVAKNLDQNNFKISPNSDTDILPNRVYKVGEIYTVKDSKGIEVKMTIEALSIDGKEITTSVDTRKIKPNLQPSNNNTIPDIRPTPGFVGDYITPARQGTPDQYVDVSLTLKSNSLKKLAGLSEGQYPIKLYTDPTGSNQGKTFGKVQSNNGLRNVYESNPEFDKFLVNWSYKSANGFEKKARVNKNWLPTLDEMASLLDRNDMWNSDHIVDWSPSIIRRDVTPSSGVKYGQISGHAFGLAIDINFSVYPLGTSGAQNYKANILKPTDTKEYKTANVLKVLNENFVINKGGTAKVFWQYPADTHHFSVFVSV